MVDIIDNLNLSTIEEKVYLHLLANGQLAIDELADALDISINDVNRALETLRDKNLIFTNPSIIKKYAPIYPMMDISEKAKESLEKIRNIGSEINAYADEKIETLDRIIDKQKTNIKDITSEAKEKNREEAETAVSKINTSIDSLIEEISQILNKESTAIASLTASAITEISQDNQATTEKAGNTISSSISKISNSLSNSGDTIRNSFEESANKVLSASETMKESLEATMSDNYKNYQETISNVDDKVSTALDQYSQAAANNMDLNEQTVSDNYSKIIDSVDSRIDVHDQNTKQVLEERFRNITSSMAEMNVELTKLISDKLAIIQRQYQEAIEAFNRNVDTIFSDANSQLESLLNTKTKMNAENVENLIKLLKEDLEKRVSETKTDIRSKENRLHTELTSVTETSKRKMNEIQDKLNMEVATTFNKAGSDLESNQKHILNVLNRAKTDIDTRFQEARNASLASIDQEFKEQEDIFADTGSKLVDEIRLLTSTWENKTVNLLKETKDRAQSAISNIEMPAKSLLNEGKQTAVTQIKEEEKHTEKTIEQAKSGLEDTIIAQTSNVQQQFKGFGSKFKEGNKMIEKILANFELTYRELITKIKDMPRHTMNTMSVVGKDAVLAQMKEIFNRVKSTVTLVYPKVQDIPEDLLLNSNPRTRIIVISDFDQFKNASLIKSLMSKDNIQLKSLDIDATAPYYAIGRDHKEEGLIATLDVSGEVVGITSNSPQFVELISTEIINGVITPKTKRVTLPESEQL